MKSLSLLLIGLFFSATAAGAEVIRLSLDQLAPLKTADIKCISGEYTVKLPIPERWKVKRARLKLPYVNSSGLLKGKSRMVVKLNDYPLKQFNLSPVITEGVADVSIPAHLLGAGYNDLSFNISQHYLLQCELPCAEDLWTTLNLAEGSLEIEYSLKEVPLKISSISDFLFDSRMLPEGKVNIIMEDSTSQMVTNAGIVASGIARRFDYRKVSYSNAEDVAEGFDNVLIGKGEFVRGFLRGKGLEIDEITAPLLKIMHLPLGEGKADPFHALLVISGTDEDQIKLAAETMAIISFPYPDSEEMLAMEFSLPDIPQYSGRQVLSTDKIYDFKTLNIGNHTFRGINPTPKEISFRLPTDFFVKQNLYTDISLHFTYGASMRSDSVLNILVNGKEIRGIPLDDPSGAIIEGYKISVPTYFFKAGTNVITLDPVLTPSETKNCEIIQTENLFLTILESSNLYFPPMPHFVKLPRLDLFFVNGFPFTRWPDGYESMIYLTDKDPNIISSSFNLIGLITQKNGYPLFEMQIGFDKPADWSGELIVIGDVGTIPEELKEVAPLKLTEKTSVPYPVVRSWAGEEMMAFSKQISALGKKRGVITEFQSPYNEGRTVLLLTAASTDSLLSFSDALLEPSVQAHIKGDVALVDLDREDYRVSSLVVAKKYFSGKSGKISKMEFYLHTYPYLYQIALAIVIIVLGLSSFYLLRRYRRKRLGGSEEADS